MFMFDYNLKFQTQAPANPRKTTLTKFHTKIDSGMFQKQTNHQDALRSTLLYMHSDINFRKSNKKFPWSSPSDKKKTAKQKIFKKKKGGDFFLDVLTILPSEKNSTLYEMKSLYTSIINTMWKVSLDSVYFLFKLENLVAEFLYLNTTWNSPPCDLISSLNFLGNWELEKFFLNLGQVNYVLFISHKGQCPPRSNVCRHSAPSAISSLFSHQDLERTSSSHAMGQMQGRREEEKQTKTSKEANINTHFCIYRECCKSSATSFLSESFYPD